ncbi:MAG: BREX-2 system adenine-specific DNA-methyltransferase PglX [Pseudonocardia sp.]
MIDSKALLADLQKQVRLLEVDLAEQVAALPGVADLLRAEHAAERKARRTAVSWESWRDAQLTQIAVAWVLGTVFLRWSEDNGLIEPVLSGPGDRLAIAEDAQLEHYRRHPEHTDGDWLAEQFEVLRCTDAGRLLFDEQHNPMYWIPLSHDAAKALTAFWRSHDGGGLRHSFVDPTWDTRFLGDLYQDLSEDAKKRYALLQTPRFVERFILDRTLKPAMEEFGLDGLRLIDPACGSGHFLLGAFSRLVEAWRAEAPGLDAYEIVRRSLASVHGVDMNPFAVAIARFRLLVAALREAGVRTFAESGSQNWRPVVGCKDSLLPLVQQGSFEMVDDLLGHRARWEDVHEFADQRLLADGTYHAVVGNPPYISVKDAGLREEYRKIYSKVCSGKYTLAVPFVQRIFELARRPAADGLGAGYTGQITSNAFMKREFGKKLIEDYLPTVELNYVVDASGAYIPGHGTPTVILIGRRARPNRRDVVRTVLGVRGEPSQPAIPEQGLVWSAILAQVEDPGSESEWITVLDLPREQLAAHPWSLTGGGASDLVQMLERGSHSRLGAIAAELGIVAVLGQEEAFEVPAHLNEPSVDLVVGEEIRDYALSSTRRWWPYDSDLTARSDAMRSRWMWPGRTVVRGYVMFGKTRTDRGIAWFEYGMLGRSKIRVPRTIAFAFVATHNHFVLDRGGKVFKQTAPVIKLPAGASEDDHLALLGVLNSSTACFWLRQAGFNKGGDPIGNEGARVTGDAWADRYEFPGTQVQRLPLPANLPLEHGRLIDELAQRLAAAAPDSVIASATPTRDRLAAARTTHDHRRARMIYEQEELDWDVYRRYGLLSKDEAAAVTRERSAERALNLGERAFEIVLARKVQAGEAETQWFARHGSTPITEIPAHWSDDYKDTVQARIDLIEKRRDLALIERPECKRRWSSEPWGKQQERALRHWLLDRLEARHLWFAADLNGDPQPAPQTVKSLADQVRGDDDFIGVARLWAGDALHRPDADLAEVVGALVDAEHVPFLAAYRYKPSGLARRQQWEHTWELQRREDAIAERMGHDDVTHPEVRAAIAREIGEVPVPPKYGSGDFLKASYWTQRGKLDVPKERFVSYPAATRDGDGSLLLGWAGWDHREQAQALAVLIGQRRGEDGWPVERVAPLLAGLAEVLPWVHQWHAEIDPVFGAAPGDIFDGFLDAQLAELHLSRRQLAGWRPEGRVNVTPLPDVRRQSGRATVGFSGTAISRPRRPRSAPDQAHLDAVLHAAADGPLSNEQIRELTGFDAAGARAVAQQLVTEGRLSTTGQRRGMRYLLT